MLYSTDPIIHRAVIHKKKMDKAPIRTIAGVMLRELGKEFGISLGVAIPLLILLTYIA